MKFTSRDFIYALDVNGHSVHIDEVKNGDACGCTCPCCGKPLCAKNNEKNRKEHHFAHQRGYKDCKGACESAVHMLAKEILAERKTLMIPSFGEEEKERLLKFDEVRVEERDDETNLRPDCIGICGGKEYWVEFRNTHAVPPVKITKIVSKKINCIELDLRDCLLDKESIRQCIEESDKERIWVYSDTYPIGYYTEKFNPYEIFWTDWGARICLERHYAYDSKNNFVNLCRNEDLESLDLLENPCRCIFCGEPLMIDLGDRGGYKFIHEVTSPKCGNDEYLISLAKYFLFDHFDREKCFTIQVPGKVYCEEKDCEFFSKTACFKEGSLKYRLGEPEYSLKEVPELVPGCESCLVLLLEKENGKVFIHIATNQIPDEVQAFRLFKSHLITLFLSSEQDAMDLKSGVFDVGMSGGRIMFKNFLFKKETIELNNSVFFTGFEKTRRCHVTTDCTCMKKRPPLHTASFELFFDETITPEFAPYAEYTGLFYSLIHDKNICCCKLCANLDVDPETKAAVCIKHESSGTPQNPLKWEELPARCPYFILNTGLDISKDDLSIIKLVKEYKN